MPPAFKILLVEDSESYSYLVGRVLRDIAPNVEVITRTGVLDGLDAVRLEQPTLVLLDLSFATLSGLHFLQSLHTDLEDVAVPVVVLTGSTNDALLYAAYFHYANAVVQKPDSFDDLIVMLRALCDFWLRVVRLPISMRGRTPSHRGPQDED